MPTPYDLTGDERWSPYGELFKEYDLELDVADDQGSSNDGAVENVTDEEIDPDKIIDFSKMHQPGVKVLSENKGSKNKNIGNNGDGSAIHSQISEKQLYDEFSGILSIN